MSRFLGAAAVLTACVMGVSIAQAQNVGMAGEYSESNGVIIQIPQNPPNIDCAADDTEWNAQNQAACPRIRQALAGSQIGPIRYIKPHHGVYGARLGTATPGELPTPTQNGGLTAGLNPGDPFRMPPLLMQQRLGLQAQPVLNADAVRQLDTTFTAAAPGVARDDPAYDSSFKAPAPNTRVFYQQAWQDWDNGETPSASNYTTRALANTAFTLIRGQETVVVNYTNSNPNQFGGTMTVLLDGSGRLYLKSAELSSLFQIPPGAGPLVATNPVGDQVAGFRVRNGAGWNYTAAGAQVTGYAKIYGLYATSVTIPTPSGTTMALINPVADAVVAPDCALTPPPTPAGCNEINFWRTALSLTTPSGMVPITGFNQTPSGVVPATSMSLFRGAPGLNLGPLLQPATSTKHMFGLTTGTVRISRVGVRDAGTLTDTVTARGYDTVTTGGQRNLGLVAGSFSERADGVGFNINAQMLGVDMKFTPEPGATVALLSGLGLLGALSARRRR